MNKRYILGSISSGVFIGLGVIINSLCNDRLIGAVLFSFGLLSIIELKIPLYTGRIGFINDKWLPVMLLLNLVGVIGIVSLYCLGVPNFHEIISDLGDLKFRKSFIEMLVCGILCGMLIHIAVLSKNKIIVCMAVCIFILIGAEHCVADFPFLVFNFSLYNFFKFVFVIVGNSIGAVFVNMIANRGDKY